MFTKVEGMKKKKLWNFQNNSFVSIFSSVLLRLILDLPNCCPENFELMF